MWKEQSCEHYIFVHSFLGWLVGELFPKELPLSPGGLLVILLAFLSWSFRLHWVHGVLWQHRASWPDTQVHWCSHPVWNAELQPSSQQLQVIGSYSTPIGSLRLYLQPTHPRLCCHEDRGEFHVVCPQGSGSGSPLPNTQLALPWRGELSLQPV